MPNGTSGFVDSAAMLRTDPGGRKKDPRVQHCIERGLEWIASTQSRTGSWSRQRRHVPHGHDGAGRHGAAPGRLDHHARQVRPQHSPCGRLSLQPQPLQRPDRRSHPRRSLHLRPRLFDAVPLAGAGRGRRRSPAQGIDSTCSTKAVEFSGQAQTDAGGWGYVSAKDGGGFDEGSTTITQVQGLRGCRNAGIPVPKEIIDKAIKYIHNCTLEDGGVQYSSKGGGRGRPSPPPPSPACSTPAITTTSSSPKC